jgi:hypothetical protein
LNPLRNLDWRVLLFGFIACYALPWLLFGMVVSGVIRENEAITGWRLLVFNSYLVIYFVAMPLAAGYFTAKFAKNRPQLHVLLIVLLGTGTVMLARPDSLLVQAGVGVFSLLMASLGAFVVLRGASK